MPEKFHRKTVARFSRLIGKKTPPPGHGNRDAQAHSDPKFGSALETVTAFSRFCVPR
jgi:hypothetical protein